jgi:hypothetical protein
MAEIRDAKQDNKMLNPVDGRAASQGGAEQGATGRVSLDDEQIKLLRCLAGMMIPSDPTQVLPGADDAAVFEDIIKTLGRDLPRVQQALSMFQAGVSQQGPDSDFAALPESVRWQLVESFRTAQAGQAALLAEVVVRCYYRDDRVMRAIGMEPRAPFPEGFEVEPGNWQLLEPVRARGSIYRHPNKP